MKRTVIFLLILTLLLALPATALAGIDILINYQEYTFDPPPFIQEGRTLVPMRAFFEALGAHVNWEAETQTAVGVREGVEVRIPIGSTRPTVNGQATLIDVPAQIFESRTFIPLRFVGEALGDNVSWDGSTRTITITRGDGVPKITPVEDVGELVVHFIDVGQGDAILVQSPSGATMLIDGGPRTAGQKLVEYLKQAGIDSIDKVVATHPHADHIGGPIDVFDAFKVGKVYDSRFPYDTATFRTYKSAISDQNIELVVAHRTNPVNLCPELTITIAHPGATMGDANNNSIVLKLEHGEIGFLFTGDAERQAEQQMLDYARAFLPSEILKVGHHGSRTSTTPDFLTVVSPEVAVIMCGEGNRYGHPHQEVLDRLATAGVKIYRTDISGNIVIHSDGASYDVAAVPFEYTPTPTEPAPTPSPGRININTASFEQLQEIVHIGPARAEDIIRLRPFSSLDGLSRVTGIGPARLRDIKDEGKAYVE